MNEQTDWQQWCEFFHDVVDLGPADSDVRQMIYEEFKEETGITLPEMEDN